ncbi:response regulator transcription factor [Streptomyces sp. WAC06614]|uniref:response regulator n=1 Tax=Streptomyces sp. WAC06614 TaxID=2487416 RepID=UPI000F79F50C|nr:response regulator transcription factor [Streptomyces sp. WAC06614]RSS64835.1 DNA-binding response regulator [Streptomyces sp. WAC06614]
MTIRALIADDQIMIRQGFSALLGSEPDIQVVGQAADGVEAVALAEELRPDVILMDIRMPGMDGIEATRQITRNGESTAKILVLTTFDLDEYVYEALRAGASGFLLKSASAEHLAEAVRVVAAGEALLAPSVTKRLLTRFARMEGPQLALADPGSPLTERETEVLLLIAQGLANGEIAARLVIAEQTVKTYVSRILAKLGLRDRTQAVVYAYETGLVRPGRDD